MSAVLSTFGGRVALLFAYGFRPFFLLAAGYAILPILLWSGFLLGWSPPPTEGDPFAWHMHEMVYGLGGAALAGFLLTAVPEFTDCAPVTGRPLAALMACWLAARVAIWTAASIGLWPAAALNLLFLGWLIALVAKPLWTRAAGRHRAFLYGLAAIWVVEAGIFYAWLGGNLEGFQWTTRAGLSTAVGLFTILILIAHSRISMVIVNRTLEDLGDTERMYLARPPRRNLAIFAIGLFLVLNVAAPGTTLTGWVALAAMAATLNILNDWHLGRVLRETYVLALYVVLWLIALGFGSIGIECLTGGWLGRGSRHLLSTGAMGLAILAVLTIAGQIHTGRTLADTWSIRASFAAIVLAALTRAVPVWLAPSAYVGIAYGLSGLLWTTGFGLYLITIGPMLLAPRVDGEPG